MKELNSYPKVIWEDKDYIISPYTSRESIIDTKKRPFTTIQM